MLNKKNLEIVIKYLVYATFFVPLLVVPSSFIFPFIVPKVLLFRSLVMLMLGTYTLLLLINWKEFSPKLTLLNVLLGFFLVSFGISTFWGTDPYHSFWDNHERMLGLFTILHYIIYYFICSSVFKNWLDWRKAFKVFLIAGSVVMFIGLLQVINPKLLLNQGAERVASTLGNPIYVGGYGLFLLFAAYLLYIKEDKKYWRIIEIFLGIIALGGTFYSGTRGSFLGLIAGAVVGSILYLILLKNHKKARVTIGISLAVGFLVIGGLFMFRKTAFVSHIPAVGRALNTATSEFTDGSRGIAWKIAIESWKEKPLIGWGPNNFFYAFNKYYNPLSLNFGYGETWFDNAHNIILNTLAVQGLLGLISYLAIFIGAIFILRKNYYRGEKVDLHILTVGISFLVAHLVQNITVFENPTSYLYFVFWLAFINQVCSTKKDNQTQDRVIGAGSVGITGFFVLMFIFIFNIQPARANRGTLMALNLLNGGLVDQAVVKINEVLNFDSPHIDDIRGDIARSAVAYISENYQKLGKDKSLQIFDATYPALQQNLILHPLDIRTHITLSEYDRFRVVLEKNLSYLNYGESYLEQALAYSPKRQQVIYALVDFKEALGKNTESVDLLEQTIKDNPKISEGYIRLIYAYKFLFNDPLKVQQTIDTAKTNQVIFTPQDQRLIQNMLSTTTSTTR